MIARRVPPRAPSPARHVWRWRHASTARNRRESVERLAGTRRESRAHVRATVRLSPLVLCLSCAAGSPQPTTMRLLSSLPVDRERAHEQMDSATVRPSAESRRPLPPKVRQAETIAATAAALLGTLFSTSENVVLGVGGPVEETNLVPGTRATVTHEPSGGEPPPYGDANALVPWLRLTPPPAPAK